MINSVSRLRIALRMAAEHSAAEKDSPSCASFLSPTTCPSAEHALVRNTPLRQLSAVPGFFVDSSTFSSEPDMAMYRPLLQTTFALNHALGGYDGWSWHLVNVLLHALAATGAFALFRRLLPSAPALAAGLAFRSTTRRSHR